MDNSDETGCWPWTGARTRGGYGQVWQAGGRKTGIRWVYAHRIAYELATGPIPAGRNVLHRCDNPPCCRPDHLFVGTHADNMADMSSKGRAAMPNAKLSEADVAAIRSSAGETQTSLAERYGVTQSAISRILHGKRWK